MRKSIIYFVLVSAIIAGVSCTNISENQTVNPVVSQQNEETTEAIPADIMNSGSKVYKKHCFACHMIDGRGVKKVYPPLFESPTVAGDKDALIGIVLNGLKGETIVKGEKYNQIMVPHDFLSDKEIADVLTYIRNSFGNKADQVTAREVKALRK